MKDVECGTYLEFFHQLSDLFFTTTFSCSSFSDQQGLLYVGLVTHHICFRTPLKEFISSVNLSSIVYRK